MAGTWLQRNAPAEWPGRWLALRAAGRRGTALPFAITLDGRLVGHVMVGNVVREPLLSAYVGYWLDSRVTNKGVTTAAVALAVDQCLGPVGLHRLEATVRPENAAEPAGAGQARLPRGGAVPPLPRRRRRMARPPVLRVHHRGPPDRGRRGPSRHRGWRRATLSSATRASSAPCGSRGEPRRVGASLPGTTPIAHYRCPRTRSCLGRRGRRLTAPWGRRPAVPSSMIFASLVVLWLLILVPAVARHRQEVARPSVAALSGRVLARSPRRRSQEGRDGRAGRDGRG